MGALRNLPSRLRPRKPEPSRLERVHLFTITLACRRPDGSAVWEEPGLLRIPAGALPAGVIYNRFHDEGEKLALRDLFRGESVLPAAFFGRLYNATITDTSTLAAIAGGEPASNGYQAVPWSRNTSDFGSPTLQGTQHESLGVKKSFNATGAGWGPVTYFAFATSSDNAGAVFGYFALQQPRTVPGGTSLDVQPRGMLRGVTS